jgi:hypothetical protein
MNHRPGLKPQISADNRRQARITADDDRISAARPGLAGHQAAGRLFGLPRIASDWLVLPRIASFCLGSANRDARPMGDGTLNPEL